MKPIRVRVVTIVDVDPQAWQDEYGIDASDKAALRQDGKTYFATHAQDAFPATAGIVTVTEGRS